MLLLMLGLIKSADSKGSKMDVEISKTIIKFVMIDNHIVMPVAINGHIRNLILDTGMPADGAILFNCPEVEELNLKYAGQVPIAGAGGNSQPSLADVAMNATIKIGDISLEEQTIIVMPADSHRDLAFVNEGMDGIIGYGLFSRFVVAIDPIEKTVTLTDPADFKYQGQGEKIPLIWNGRFPSILCHSEIEEGKTIAMELIVDLGHSFALSLNVDEKTAITLPEKTIDTRIGRGTSGNVMGKIGRINNFQLGQYQLNNVLASFKSGPRTGPAQMEKEGNLGAEILRRFHLIFNYSENLMIIEPDDYFNDPFEHNMSGLIYSRTESGVFIVEQVQENSPAGQAGLQTNDQIYEINGIHANQVKISELNKIFLQENSEVTLGINRDGQLLNANLTLFRLI